MPGGNIKVYGLDQVGVVTDLMPIGQPSGLFLKAQNAVADPTNAQGTVRKRPGLMPFNSTAGNGTIQGGIGVPVFLGSAGPNFPNPFDGITVAVLDIIAAIDTSVQVPTFDDDGFAYPFDWNFDFADYDPDEADLTMADIPDTRSQLIAWELFATTAGGNWGGDLTVDQSTAVFSNTAYPKASFTLFPTDEPRTTFSPNTGIWGLYFGSFSNAPMGDPITQLDGVLYYASLGYTFGTTPPLIRAFDGKSDTIVARIPKNPDAVAHSFGTETEGIVSLYAANENIYVATLDDGITGTAIGSVYEFDPSTRALTKLGATFPAGQVPYSLLWAYGRLWCGTAAPQAGGGVTAGRVYWIRPGIDTVWTLDHTFGSKEAIVAGLVSFRGEIFASLLNSDNTVDSKVMKRTVLGAWSASETDSGNSALGYVGLVVWPPEDSGFTNPAPAIYAFRRHATISKIRQYNGVAWSTVYTGASGVGNLWCRLWPGSVLRLGRIEPILFVPGYSLEPALTTRDGTNWVDRSSGGAAQSTVFTSLLLQV